MRDAGPRGLILSYGARDLSPTRVRTRAARLAVAVGAASVALAMLPGYGAYAITAFAVQARLGRGATLWRHPVEVGATLLRNPLFLAAVALLAAGVVLLLAASRVRVGARRACRLGQAAAAVATLCYLGLTVVAGGLAVGKITGVESFRQSPWIVAPLALVLLALTLVGMDLTSYLSWVARRPVDEMPPLPFVPRGRGV
jgi:hypothetical protein